ncbi:MAG: hypothetical protein K9M07_04410 [Simkaniaceae bacterium]|nr:hypothetical protein [Simkaniaceae bacterium]
MAASSLCQELISHCFENPELEHYPLKLSPAQLRAMPNKHEIVALFQKRYRAPSEKAGLSGSLCGVIVHVDAVFHDSVKQYQNSIDQAMRGDIRTITTLEANPRVEVWSTLDHYLLNPVVGTACEVWKRLTGYSAIVRREGSAFRLACLIEIGVLEGKRLSDMKTVIIEGAKPMITDLKSLRDRGESDMELLKNLRQLEKVYRSEFDEDLVVSRCHVPDFLAEIKRSYPTLVFE